MAPAIVPKAVLFAAALGGLACSSSADLTLVEHERSDQHRQAIIGGAPISDPELRQRMVAVVASNSCSGFLIAPNLVATVRHCVAKLEGEAKECTDLESPWEFGDYTDSVYKIYQGAWPETFDDEPQALGVQVFAPADLALCGNDLALLLLDRELDVTQKPIRLDDSIPLETGEPMRQAGFGAIDEKNNRPTAPHERDVSLAAVGPAYFQELDLPPVGVPSRTFLIDGGMCAGDSGGPVLRASGAVAGNHSLFILADPADAPPFISPLKPTEYCLSRSYAQVTSFAHHADVFRAAFAATGKYAPWYEGRPNPPAAVGQTCEMGIDCTSAVCVDTGTEKVCSAECSADTECADGFTCVPSNHGPRYCVAEPGPLEPTPSCALVPATHRSVRGRLDWFVALLVGLALLRRRACTPAPTEKVV